MKITWIEERKGENHVTQAALTFLPSCFCLPYAVRIGIGHHTPSLAMLGIKPGPLHFGPGFQQPSHPDLCSQNPDFCLGMMAQACNPSTGIQ